jgi:hypothetical protein
VKKLRNLLDLFFTEYVKLSPEKANLLGKGAVIALFTLVKAKKEFGALSKDPKFRSSKWETINFYKILIKFSIMLHCATLFKVAPYNQRKEGLSFIEEMLKAFATLIYQEQSPSDSDLILRVLISGLNYLQADELPYCLSNNDYEEDFIDFLNPLFADLFSKARLVQDAVSAIDDGPVIQTWRTLITA